MLLNLNLPSDLVIVYHWLAFLTVEYKTTNNEYKINHISKTKNRKIVKLNTKSVSEHCTFFGIMKKKLGGTLDEIMVTHCKL